ncbi:hypothetical protein CL673_08465 [Candidatus Bathyarchaeota archaeon]|nr:hypothetical protein [Candidatus Bathyarchaeota archaeon]
MKEPILPRLKHGNPVPLKRFYIGLYPSSHAHHQGVPVGHVKKNLLSIMGNLVPPLDLLENHANFLNETSKRMNLLIELKLNHIPRKSLITPRTGQPYNAPYILNKLASSSLVKCTNT